MENQAHRGLGVEPMSNGSIFLLVAGGLSYTIGAIGYATKRPKLFPGIFGFHELWHVMVILGAAFHYLLILGFYSPSMTLNL